MKTILLTWLACTAQAVLAVTVALPIFVFSLAARRFLRRGRARMSQTRGRV
jgi:hypothetical protein